MFLRPLDAAYSILYIRDDRYVYRCTSTEESIPVCGRRHAIYIQSDFIDLYDYGLLRVLILVPVLKMAFPMILHSTGCGS